MLRRRFLRAACLALFGWVAPGCYLDDSNWRRPDWNPGYPQSVVRTDLNMFEKSRTDFTPCRP